MSDLAQRPDFQLGPLSISPSRRRVEGPVGVVQLEPLVMHVLLLLVDARGDLVTRDQLFDQVWGGAMVGDDSLNRAIARVRKVASETAPGSFEIETIPRAGYRLTGAVSHAGDKESEVPRAQPRLSRRVLVGGGAAAAAVVGAGGLWWIDSREDREFAELMSRGQEALAYNDPSARPVEYYRRAVAIRPDDARAQGLYAYTLAYASESVHFDEAATALRDAERAVRAALAIDPREPYARLAEIVMQRSLLDIAGAEDRLREILKADPSNVSAMRQLWNLLQCAGRSSDALALVERAISVAPLAAGTQFPRAQLLWILGRNAEADRVISKAMQYWPSHRFVRFAQFNILAFTGRPRAALAMLEKPDTAPQTFSAAGIALWRINLAALDQRTPSTIDVALKANLDAAKGNFQLASQAVLALSALGKIDAAFEIANALFVVSNDSADRPAKSTAWRFAPWLFTPPTEPMRSDPRFTAICDQAGLTDYWVRRRIKPDYQLDIA